MASVPPTAPTLTETYPEFINLWFKLTVTDRNGNQDSDMVYVRIEDLDPETFQIPPAAHAVVNYAEGTEAFLENTRVKSITARRINTRQHGISTPFPHNSHAGETYLSMS